ncbi:Peptidyl-prolyl isomerase CWC27 [Yarrowia sp. B02]|nr:Peptidyl-prolyl isomerase CWC27 [Yarrowia sp. B02]
MEPQTSAKVVLQTSKGPIEVELFAKEVPNASKRFLELCKAGFYDTKPFHRVLPGELIQCGADDTNSFSKLRDEPHSRIRLKRGYLGMAPEYVEGRRVPNSGRTEFFVALKEIPFNGSVFGKISGDTIYNAQDIAKGELTEDGYPLFVQRVESVDIVLGGGLVEETSDKAEECVSESNDKPKPAAKPKAKTVKRKQVYDEDEEEPVFTKKSVSKLVEEKFKKEVKQEKKQKVEEKTEAVEVPVVKTSTTSRVQDAEIPDENSDVINERLEKFRNMSREKVEKPKNVLISRDDRIRRRLGLGSDDEVPSDASDPSSDEDDDFDIFKHRFVCPEEEKGEDSLVTLG